MCFPVPIVGAPKTVKTKLLLELRGSTKLSWSPITREFNSLDLSLPSQSVLLIQTASLVLVSGSNFNPLKSPSLSSVTGNEVSFPCQSHLLVDNLPLKQKQDSGPGDPVGPVDPL